MSLQDMVERFETSRLTQGNTIVNFEKLDFLQRQHVMNVTTVEEILERVQKVVTDMFGEKCVPSRPPLDEKMMCTDIFFADLKTVTKSRKNMSAPFSMLISQALSCQNLL
jgi:glutamyl/glutaminyl-tRNA synthetase